MSSIYRSEEMTLCHIFFQLDVVFSCVSELGELGIVQFQELNAKLTAFQRKYSLEVSRCTALERKLRYLEKEVKAAGLDQKSERQYLPTPTLKEITYIENKLDLIDEELRGMNEALKVLQSNLMELVELQFVLKKSQTIFEEAEMSDTKSSEQSGEDTNLLEQGDMMSTRRAERELAEVAGMKLSVMTGVIPRKKLVAFELVLWRYTHGKALLRYYEINEPIPGDPAAKLVFVIFCQGSQLKERVRKICTAFKATLYPCPESSAERREQSTRVANTIQDLKLVIARTEGTIYRMLSASSKAIPDWAVQIRKVKAVYFTMNMFAYDISTNCLIAECWIPKVDIETVTYALKKATDISGSNIPPILNRMRTNEDPPTFNRVNKFTQGFQVLVDSYGVASYREVNPATFTIITFPFLFAIMFGDAGHGVIMVVFGAALILKEKKVKIKPGDELAKIFFGGRYIILLMGLFSIYVGLIYNDVFSKAVNIFGSSWKINLNLSTVFKNEKDVQLNPSDPKVIQVAYSFGIDPAWPLAHNKINFLNSFKMKISIILGVLHMMFGVIVSQRNYRYFKKRISIWCEFVPQLTFLTCLFGYLAFLMIFKWIAFGPQYEVSKGPYCAPSILIRFINMMLLKPNEPLEGCMENMFPFQDKIQYVLLGVGMFCIPWMLVAKPLATIARHRRKLRKLLLSSYERSRQSFSSVSGEDALAGPSKAVLGEERVSRVYEPTDESPSGDPAKPMSPSISLYSRIVEIEPEVDESSSSHEGDEDDNDMAEMFIHQAIHTIEFVLGSVSHTASYLRLWALSLAHQQLSEVLWSMVISQVLVHFDRQIGFGIVNGIMLWIAFAAWAFLTIGILVLMEGLSAFLHTLRLHWVEFQSKFYHGLGYRFTPFSFRAILEKLEEEKAEQGLL